MWNYRVIRFKDKDSEEFTYGLYETFYNDEGDIVAHAELPEIVGESLHDIGHSLRLMSQDYKKHAKDPLLVLDGNNIKFADFERDLEDAIPFEGLEPDA